MAKQNEALFEESSQGSVSAVTALVFVVSAILVFGGMYLLGCAFEAEAADLWFFSGGLAAMFVGLMLPFAWLPAIGK